MRDRDSPIEYTGEAHLVGVTCKLCDESDTVPETEAHLKDEKDIPHVCSDCGERLDDLWSNLFIREQVDRLRLMADYLEARGFHSKGPMVRELADKMELYEPVVRATEACRSGDFSFDREGMEKAIQKYDS